MKVLIIYVSFHHKNTEKIVNYLKNNHNVSSVDLQKTSFSKIKISLKKHQIIGFASGIYFGKHHQLLFKFLDCLSKTNNKKAFIFSTAGMPFLKFLWHLPLQKKLKEKGFKVVADFCLPGYDTVGILKLFGGINKKRPNKKDLQKAEKIILKIGKI